MKLLFHKDAEIEFVKAIEYYENCKETLGYDFAVEIYSTIERIKSQPKAWPLIDDGIRRSLVQRFPYGVLYSVEKNIYLS